MPFIWIGLGGFLGANLRYALGRWITSQTGTVFPWGTGIVNVTGAFLIGLIATLLASRTGADPAWRQFLVVGILGGYTTFSSFALEGVSLMQDGRWPAALAYIIGTNVLGILACFAGIGLARAIGG